jgi:hypothetical protein
VRLTITLTKELAMKNLSKTLAAAAMAAQAEDLKVAVGANFTLPPLTDGPGNLSIGFELAEPIPGAIAEFDTSFRLENFGVDARLRDLWCPATTCS